MTETTENDPVVATERAPLPQAPGVPLADPVMEARRVLDEAAQAGVPLRAIGGVAIRLRTGDGCPASLQRSYGDIDLVTAKGRSGDVSSLLGVLGYHADQRFNALHGKRRMIFLDEANDRHLDVFVGVFEMCHALPLAARLDLETDTVPAAELLLTKLQVVQLNRKDISDALALLLAEPLSPDDDDGINAGVVARLCSVDWGLWRTCKQNLARLSEEASQFDLPADAVVSARAGIAALWARIESEPKSSKWRLRDRVGDRKRWYEEPEETM